MEVNGYSHFEQAYLVNELTQGMELARQLRAQMGPEHSTEAKEMLLQQIVSSYDKALFVLGCGAAVGQPNQVAPVQSPLMPSSPSSIVDSPKGNDLNARSSSNQKGKGCSMKRKSASTWTRQMKQNSKNGLDGSPDDGYCWRKYGQKDILGAKNPRSYYRCTYRSAQDCWATRQVQISDKDPTMFDITYKGQHTCTMVRRSKSAPTSPGKQESKPESQQDSAMNTSFQTAPPPNNAEMHSLDGFPSMTLGCLKSESPTFSTSNLNSYGNLSASLVSPSATSDSNYFSISDLNLENFPSFQHQQHNMELDIAETIDPEFSLDPWSFSQNFAFSEPGFFP